MDNNDINIITEELLKVLRKYKIDIALIASTTVTVTGYVINNCDKKDFMHIMSEMYDEFLITKMKLAEVKDE